MNRIRIIWPEGELSAVLEKTPTVEKLFQHLPYENNANTWGDEVYFSLPFDAEAEADATDVVELGAVCFWLAGSALALLFGPTPVSQGNECRLISAANILGKIEGDARSLKTVRSGDKIRVEAA